MEVIEELGRFGHHPDPAIDFEVEVTSISAMTSDLLAMDKCQNDDDTPSSWQALVARIERAMDFRVGGVPSCVSAKAALRICDKAVHEYVVAKSQPWTLAEGAPKTPDTREFDAAIIATYPSSAGR